MLHSFSVEKKKDLELGDYLIVKRDGFDTQGTIIDIGDTSVTISIVANKHFENYGDHLKVLFGNIKLYMSKDDYKKYLDDKVDKGQKYQREIKQGVFVDIYDVLRAWGVNCPASQHAIKKLLAAGQRGHKSKLKDLQEAANSASRAVKLHEEWPDA